MRRIGRSVGGLLGCPSQQLAAGACFDRLIIAAGARINSLAIRRGTDIAKAATSSVGQRRDDREGVKKQR